ncbi:peptidyl-prolyl cis-trans isomerase SurA [Parabacteroides sp. PF5-5]|uniref:peptidylprolyl isomerase n=1 Tax=unclassified Parabacteroides TaxID=2649774 RepID=UPI002474A623|nr:MULTISPECIES: peptidylprolyl isomerase [unclassified Parabacteroides]MDH6305032.1 peptidyl-prolyl cis-trans isomerase SurA [Parabacteroides sp. PH5-39]MDH6315883.1 peptidyl-prolyl cis-trans isomerase SurA [Parabacteroides sp. PF5-13]MDH6319540.1 peptidyl-prolyl cis-trans isomerase SurA [Parabacteroides sp. PH5-13]MDH6323271.1 peptidyl-prolyl cis-trans isomerase SurA [Parabacteroides sp. PH5-8]MDH6327221.1 peptidyl-prolyl cis-trans isomerase SurA [Parabacteroides sp. PH5-41]
MMKKIFTVFFLACCLLSLNAQENVIDEIVWVVGDDAILRSDIESQRLYMQNEGVRMDGDPYCVIPEEMAVQKLYLNQAKIDSVDVSETQVLQNVDQWMNFAMNQIGSKEKMEEYFNKKYSQIKEERKEMVREQQIVQQMQRTLVENIKLTPADVRKFYNQIPKDSLPNIPTTVEVQIVTLEPKIPFEETDAIKARLRDFTEQITSGKMEFSTLARLYSEDVESAKRGGELGFMGKTNLLPEFANVAFNLNDPKRVSNIVETEYGFHIIQLIEKRGDRINCRHILLRPKVSEREIVEATTRLDSLYNDLQANKFSFEEAATFVSYDKDTRNNKGLMINQNYEGNNFGTPKFEMQELPQEIGKIIYNMQIGEMSKPFTMLTSKQKEVVAIVKLKARTDAHKANMTDDYQALKAMVEDQKREELLKNWIIQKQKTTYVRISDGWKNCDFKYPGWIKE